MKLHSILGSTSCIVLLTALANGQTGEATITLEKAIPDDKEKSATKAKKIKESEQNHDAVATIKHGGGIITKETRTVFSPADTMAPDIGKSFSNALGWVIWKTPGTALCEVTSVTGFDRDGAGEMADGNFTIIYDPKKGKFDKVSEKEYSEWGLKSRLGMYTGNPDETSSEGGNAVLLSVRDSFSYFNANQEGFGLDYTNSNGDSSWKVKGALMLDFYLDPLYNRWDDKIGQGNPYRFWLRTGLEMDRDDTATKPFDRTSYYLLGNFQANPNQSARILGFGSHALSPQFLQIGAALDHDEFTGENDLRWILGWQPQFYLSNDIIPGWGKSFGINRIMHYKEHSFGQLFKPLSSKNRDDSEKVDKPSPWYSSIPMDLKLSGGSELLAAAFQNDADSADDALLEWKIGLFVGNSKHRFRFGYFAEGASPVIDPSETHVGHRVVAEIGLGNLSEETLKKQRDQIESMKKDDKAYEHLEPSKSDLGAMTVFAEYRFGAPAPTYRKEEIFQIGTRIRF